jgi:hypothetical protein
VGFKFSHGFGTAYGTLDVGDNLECLFLYIESYYVPVFSAVVGHYQLPARAHSNVDSLSLILVKLSDESYRRAGLSTSFNELTNCFLARS